MKRVLIIQEDIVFRRILERLAASLNFEVLALESLFQLDIQGYSSEFDAVITDILFEGVGPLDFPHQIQEVVAHKHLFIVTNMGQDFIKKKILAIEGVSGFYGIPFDLDELEIQLKARG